jgi:hypothetical protein
MKRRDVGNGGLLWVLVLGACAGAEAGPSAAVRDSAGVTIVENPAALAEREAWTVAAEPTVAIGVLEGDERYQFSRVGSGVRLSDGRIVVANGGTHELRYYDASGAHLVSVGRQGEGPGEFQGLELITALPGDSLAAYDFNLRRISFFDSSGAFVRSVLLDFTEGYPSPVGRFADGSWLSSRGFTFSPGDDGSDVIRDTVPLMVFGADGALRDTAGVFPGVEVYLQSEGGAAWASSLPFGRTTEVAVSGSRFYAGHTERYEIARYTPEGAPELIIRLGRAAVPVGGVDVDRLKAERLENANPTWRQRTERMFADMPLPGTFPAFGDLMADPDGHLWVLDYPRPGEDARRWTVFSSEGRALGFVATPPGLRVLEIGRDHVLGVWLDDLDVEHVRLYRLEREEL